MNAKELGAQPIAALPPIDCFRESSSPHLKGQSFPDKIFRDGLTKRELFAAMALQGLLSAPIADYENADPAAMAEYKGHPIGEFFASESVRFADRLLAELAKEQT